MATFLLPACAITLVLLFFSPVPTFAGDYILDIHGQQAVNSADYYIEPQLYGTGGLTVTPSNSSLCPEYMIKQQVYSAGSPFSIAPVTTSTQYLTTGLPVVLYFTHTPSSCNNLLHWSVNPNKDSNYQSYVTIEDDKAQFNSTYYFTIEQTKESKYGYNIMYCLVNGQCNALGFVNGVLGINPNEPFPFVFVLAY